MAFGYYKHYDKKLKEYFKIEKIPAMIAFVGNIDNFNYKELPDFEYSVFDGLFNSIEMYAFMEQVIS